MPVKENYREKRYKYCYVLRLPCAATGMREALLFALPRGQFSPFISETDRLITVQTDIS